MRSPRRQPPPTRAGAAGEAAEAPAEATEPTEPGLPGLESLARTGFSVAGGVAALGVRVAEEAVAALRGAIDRR